MSNSNESAKLRRGQGCNLQAHLSAMNVGLKPVEEAGRVGAAAPLLHDLQGVLVDVRLKRGCLHQS